MGVVESNREFEVLFEKIFKEYFEMLCFYAMSFVKDEDTAKDIVHDVFYSVWNHRSTIDFNKPIQGYLLNLTRNRSINHIQHLKVKDKHVDYQQNFAEVYLVPDNNVDEELVVKVMMRIEKMPERCREVMKLYFMDCKKQQEIADFLNISINTVKTHLATGIKILRDEFPKSILMFIAYRYRGGN